MSPVSPVGFGGVVGVGSGGGQTGWARLNRLKVTFDYNDLLFNNFRYLLIIDVKEEYK